MTYWFARSGSQYSEIFQSEGDHVEFEEQYHGPFKTFSEAKKSLISKLKDDIQDLQHQLATVRVSKKGIK